MLRFGLLSDLHLEFRKINEWIVLLNKINSIDVDYIILAGDLHPQKDMRSLFLSGVKLPYFFVHGNHEFYGSTIQDDHWTTTAKNKIKIVGATLWTDFKQGNPMVMMAFRQMMNDARCIKSNNKKVLCDEILEYHHRHKKYIEEKKPHIVITHHSPSFQSVHEDFRTDYPSNYYFHSDLDNFILFNQNIKLWIHGHTHRAADYMIGDTRIVNNALGYPHENMVENYNIKVIEYGG